MKKRIGWIIFALGIPYLIVMPALVKGYADSTGNPIFGGMTLQMVIAGLLIVGGWTLAHPKKKNEE